MKLSHSPADLIRNMFGVQHPDWKILYKYRVLNPAELAAFERTCDIIKKAELYFSSPAGFNDPFDCHVEIDTDNTLDEIRNYIVEQNTIQHCGFTVDEIENKAQYLSQNPKQWNSLINGAARRSLDQRGVLCFAVKPDVLLFWAHYAGSHTGICLGFEVLKQPEYFTLPIKVDYRNAYPRYNHLRDRNRAHELMAVKSKDWQYEDEVRIIRPKYGPQTFEKRILRKVIFGVHTPIDVREKFRQLTADEGYTNVEFFECLLKNGDFGLTLHSI